MAFSLSDAIIKQKKQTIADKLATQTEDLQKQPWWKTIGKMAMPLAAMVAAGPVGAALSSLGGGAGIFGTLGGALTQTGGAGGILKTLGQTGVKALFNLGASGLGGGILDKLDKRSAKDIKLEGASETLHGREARDKLIKQYKDAKEAEKGTSKVGSILSAIMAQGGPGAFLEAGKVGLFAPEVVPTGATFLSGLSEGGVEGAQQLAGLNPTTNILGGEANPLQQIMSGQKSILDPNALQAVSAPQNLLNQQMSNLTGQYDFGQNLIKDAPSRFYESGNIQDLLSKGNFDMNTIMEMLSGYGVNENPINTLGRGGR